jgi:hypothetical protein
MKRYVFLSRVFYFVLNVPIFHSFFILSPFHSFVGPSHSAYSACVATLLP